jgi:glyoxylase-like metal-dependent hydrolase (beta-lactamase superfamily II)
VSALTEIAPGVFVATSEFMLTSTTVVAGSDGLCLLIDPGVTVAEVTGLAAAVSGCGLRPAAAWSTHPHWDHVLWHSSLGNVPRYAAPAAVAVAETERDGMIEDMRQSAPGHDLSLFGRLVPLAADAIPWAGPTAELIVHDGHAPGHGAVFLPGSGVLVAGDMCSDVEIPLLDTLADDPLGDYRTGLSRLAAISGVRQVVPGHGHVGDAGKFGRRLAADSAYLDALSRGEPFDDPRITTDWMRAAHAEHLRYYQRLLATRAYWPAFPPSSSTDAAPVPTRYRVGTSSLASASTCPLPGFRAKRGCAPPATCNRDLVTPWRQRPGP